MMFRVALVGFSMCLPFVRAIPAPESGVQDKNQEHRWARMEYFSDESCQKKIWTFDYLGLNEEDYAVGYHVCYTSTTPVSAGVVWARLTAASTPDMEVIFTRGTLCTVSNVLAQTFAAFLPGSSQCVRLGSMAGTEGVKISSHGDNEFVLMKRSNASETTSHRVPLQEGINYGFAYPAGVTTSLSTFVEMPDHFSNYSVDDFELAKRNWVTGQYRRPRHKEKKENGCTHLVQQSSEPSFMNSIKVSDVIDCRQSLSYCSISSSTQHTKTVSTQWSVGPGVKIGPVNIGATFGMSFINSDTTSLSETNTVPPGQIGYLSTYARSKVFKGYFDDCPDNPHVEVGVLLKDTQRHAVVLTNV